MKIPGIDRWFRWLKSNYRYCKYDLSASAMPFPDLQEAGIETDIAEFMKVRDEAYGHFASALSRFLNVKEECIVPVGSASQTIFMASFILSLKSKDVAVPVPEYEPILTVPETFGTTVHRFDYRDGREEKGMNIMCSAPNNPLGSMPDWLNSVRDTEGTVFADETFLPFSAGFRTLFRENMNFLCSGTTTKYFGLGDFKTGWFLSDPSERDLIQKISEQVSPGMSRYSLWMGAQALGSEHYFRKRASEAMEISLKLVDDFVEETAGLSWEKPDSAPYGFVRFNGSGSEKMCSRILKDSGVFLVPGDYMGDDSGFRLCFTTGPEEVEKALNRLRDYFSRNPVH